MRRVAFDLDETLGVPLIDGARKVGWQLRPGAADLLDRLKECHTLCLWSVSPRRYVDQALRLGLDRWFAETYSWDELRSGWKDVRAIRANWLIDDSPHHREAARRHGIESTYLVVPAYGSPEDAADPLRWVRSVEAVLATGVEG